MFSPCGPLIREHGSREHCASEACRNEKFTGCIVLELASGGHALQAKLARTDIYLDCICHRSFRRMSFCSGDERGALEYLIKPSKARTGSRRKTRKFRRRSREVEATHLVCQRSDTGNQGWRVHRTKDRRRTE